MQADWMYRELLRASYQRTLWDLMTSVSIILLCSVLCLNGSCKVQFTARSFRVYDCYVEKRTRTKHAFNFDEACPSGHTLPTLVKSPQHFD